MFEIKEFEAKNVEEVEKKISEELGLDNVVIKEKEEKQNLLSKKVIYRVIEKKELIAYLKEMITELGILMENPLEVETEIEGNFVKIVIDSENNGIIIGKNGRTLQSLQYIIGQIIRKDIGKEYKLGLDVGNYKEENQKNLERDIRFIADDVVQTKVGVRLDSMNSYERRLVHNIINEYKDLETKSEGEEPNRYINIVYKEN